MQRRGLDHVIVNPHAVAQLNPDGNVQIIPNPSTTPIIGGHMCGNFDIILPTISIAFSVPTSPLTVRVPEAFLSSMLIWEPMAARIPML